MFLRIFMASSLALGSLLTLTLPADANPYMSQVAEISRSTKEWINQNLPQYRGMTWQEMQTVGLSNQVQQYLSLYSACFNYGNQAACHQMNQMQRAMQKTNGLLQSDIANQQVRNSIYQQQLRNSWNDEYWRAQQSSRPY